MDPKFESFDKIERFGKAAMFITQKIHGSNAQIYIFNRKNPVGHQFLQTPTEEEAKQVKDKYPGQNVVFEMQADGSFISFVEYLDLAVGSRSRWIAPGNDNYGFAEHVYAHKQEFIEKLGPGRHYGEWAGPGINSGEGLTQKTLILFDHWKFPPERPLPPQTIVVPVLYEGSFDLSKIESTMADLKTNGSKLVAGYMRPEGVVIRIKGERYKIVFDSEETQWKNPDKEYQKQKKDEKAAVETQFGHLMQPMRLEKLLSRDEAYLREFPKSMSKIANDYFEDLVAEGQVTGSEAEIKGVRKMLGKLVFEFIKEGVEKQGAQA